MTLAQTPLEVDYLIVGAGAMGMAFADTLLAETDATVAMVDRYAQPGGHWTRSYPFVRLHQPSVFYGVNSRELGTGLIDEDGLNAGLHELASGSEILTYFDQVMRKTLLPTGRVSYFPVSFYDGPAPDQPGQQRFHSVITGEPSAVFVRRRTVDATYMNVTVPATTPPKYTVAPGVRVVPPNDLAALDNTPGHYTIVGGGKTGIDACLWLLQQSVDPNDITWIVPRDSWFLNRANIQPDSGPGSAATGLEAGLLATLNAQSVEEIFQRVEASGGLLRLTPDVTPTAYRCATVTVAELEQLRRIKDVLRHGRVRSITRDGIEFSGVTVPSQPDTLYVDCTADGLERRPTVPVFDGARITLQAVIPCQQVFSAGFTAHIEAAYPDDVVKNELCQAASHPGSASDYLRYIIEVGSRMSRWGADPALLDWLSRARSVVRVPSGLTAEQAGQMSQFIELAKAQLEKLLDGHP